MACSCNRSLISSKLDPCSPFSSSSLRLAFHRNSSVLLGGGIKLHDSSTISKKAQLSPLSFSASFRNHICRAAEYKFPDPIPEFADSVSFPITVLSCALIVLFGELPDSDEGFSGFRRHRSLGPICSTSLPRKICLEIHLKTL